jgi:hypothetical protein
MSTARLAASALALSLAAIFAGSPAQAQDRYLPAPPMVHRISVPEPIRCFRDPAHAEASINNAFDTLQAINHERQAVSDYMGRLRGAAVGASDATRADIDRQLADYGRAMEGLDDQYAFVEKLIVSYRTVVYCDPEPRRVARLAVPIEIGFSFFEGRRVRVLDNRDHTHTVIREEGGRRTEETHPNVSRR